MCLRYAQHMKRQEKDFLKIAIQINMEGTPRHVNILMTFYKGFCNLGEWTRKKSSPKKL